MTHHTLFQAALCVDTFFVVSIRRRHTRLQGDWSSDVCSSDLAIITVVMIRYYVILLFTLSSASAFSQPRLKLDSLLSVLKQTAKSQTKIDLYEQICWFHKIGRASCREKGKSSRSKKIETGKRM